MEKSAIRTEGGPRREDPWDAARERAFAEHMDDISRSALDACGLHGLSASIGPRGLVVSGRESVLALAALAAEIPPSLEAVAKLAPGAAVDVSGSFSVDAAMLALTSELARRGVIERVGHFRSYTEGPAWPEGPAAGFGWDSASAALELRLARANAVLARLAQVLAEAARDIDRETGSLPRRAAAKGAGAARAAGGGARREAAAGMEARRRQDR